MGLKAEKTRGDEARVGEDRFGEVRPVVMMYPVPEFLQGLKETVEEEFTYDGKDNNPKSRKAGERFALYRKNITIQQALDAGMSPADVKWDLTKGYVVVATKAA